MERAGRRAVLVTAVILTIVVGGADLLVRQAVLRIEQAEERAVAENRTGALAAYLEDLVVSDLTAVEAVAAYVAVNPEVDASGFRDFARRISRDTDTLGNLAAAPDLTIRYVFPETGNESILGQSYYNLPEQLPGVLQARDTRRTVVVGPVPVIQGGNGLLVRTPVFVGEGAEAEFWGVVSSLMDFDRISAEIRAAADRAGLAITISSSTDDGPRTILSHRSDAIGSGGDGLVRHIQLPGSEWTLTALPIEGWTSRPSASPFIHIASIAIFLGTLVVFAGRIRRQSEIATSEQRLQDVTTLVSDLVWETDEKGVVRFISGNTEPLLSVPPEDLIGVALADWQTEPDGDTPTADVVSRALANRDGVPVHDYWITGAAGDRRCMRRSAQSLRGPDGAFAGLRGVDVDVTVQKNLLLEVERNAELLNLFFLQSLDAFFFMMLDEPIEWTDEADHDALVEYAFTHQRLTKVNDAMLEQYRTTEDQLIGATPADLFAHDPDAGRHLIRRLFESGTVRTDTEERRFDGTPMTLDGDYILITDGAGRVTGQFGVRRDVTLQRKAEEDLKRYIDIIDRYVITSQTDLSGTITSASSAFARISGYAVEELIGQNHRIIRHPDMPGELFEDMWKTIATRQPWHGEIMNRRKDGTSYWVAVDMSALVDHRGDHYGYMSVRRDITAQKELERVSVTDRLTGLANRQKLDEVLEQERVRYQRYQHPYSVIILDIDRFKEINDQFGHQTGDVALRAVSQVLANAVRSSDTVGRWGGEEFLVVCPQTDLNGALTLAETLRTVVEGAESGVPRRITASFGVAQATRADTTELVNRADRALYRSKEEGRNRITAASG